MSEQIISNKQYKGLSTTEAENLLKQYGLNARKPGKQKTWIKRIIGIAGEPMMLLLIATAIVYYFLGDKLETVILLLSIIPIMLIEYFQESKTDEAIKVLDKMLTTYATVMRDGQVTKLETKFLVPNDLVYVIAGDKISADGYLLSSYGLQIDESILTGESVAVTKAEINNSEINEENQVYQSTLVIQGEGYFVVSQTGDQTKYGQLGNLLEKIQALKTPLQQKIYKLVRMIAIVAIFVAIAVGLMMTLKNGWISGLLSGLTMAMSLIPEEFPVVFSVFLIMGVWRMTKKKALVREMTMVELLGSASVICTDKTGTLTEGQMTLKKIYFDNELLTPEQAVHHEKDFKELIQTALLSLEQIAVDPIEIEAQRFARDLGIDVQKFYSEHILMQDAPFEAKNKLVSHIWKDKNDGYHQFTAGAPESIIKFSKLTATKKIEIEKVLEDNFSEGYRIIGIAKRAVEKDSKIILSDLDFVGLLIMSDPPRAGVKEAIDTCQKAGIRIIMITGDNKLTAHNIAEQIGMKHNEEIFDGTMLEKLDADALLYEVSHHDIFARVQPEQKYLIVEALQKNGEIVAMTGDGVNDAPALKKANIGISMGLRGTEVARSASGMVLMDDNFATIVNAIKEGRRIYDNLRQSFAFLFSFHIPIVGMAVLPLLLKQDLIFLPIHIIFLELICDPASVLGFEKEPARRNLMQELPRPTNEPLIKTHLWLKILIQGFSITAVCFFFYYHFAITHQNPELGRTAAFVSLVLCQVLLIMFGREWEQIKSNGLLLGISGIILLALTAIIFVPVIHSAFKMTSLTSKELLYIILGPIVVAVLDRLILKILPKQQKT
ncbi:MAG: ATPase, P-type (Transporting), HAD superfamily, subfamily IC [Candidatus Magasanikbacteria bacterium GW2011_GWC2_37_14]|uniref:ATPase, P-type (Transporting), HAD superfamily, subfamily IC n=1 Tax=Candidatus Magasanikbacteria bacterium GW2011_GWC2_37_14 TaxID=1619046 RepID=A0A0G0GMP2_9BACT|nr:MAG: ATPase, P-type (Transporting), HAD superfamily, subfamily IC [Candidatus Magasanikbacteria bacterium GW2011_GWC2_37_14]